MLYTGTDTLLQSDTCFMACFSPAGMIKEISHRWKKGKENTREATRRLDKKYDTSFMEDKYESAISANCALRIISFGSDEFRAKLRKMEKAESRIDNYKTICMIRRISC